MKKIFITGSTGQLGQALIKLFKSRYEIISTSRYSYNKTDYFLDITDPILTKNLISTISPDIIINLAALTDVDLCEKNPKLANSINFHGVQNLVNAFNGPIIHLSTDYVFDGSKGQYSEEDVTNPINEYGRTKLEGEQYLAKNSNDSLIIRTNVLYDYATNSNASFLKWIVHSLNDKTVINVVDDQINNPTWTMSLAIVIDRAIQTELNGLVHWGDADWISRYEFALKIAESFNLKKDLIEPIKTAELKQTAARPLKGGLSTIYAEKILNLEPPSIEHCLHQLKK